VDHVPTEDTSRGERSGVDPADSIRELAQERLGFAQLPPGQLRAAATGAAGRDPLAVLRTGGGKSAILRTRGHDPDRSDGGRFVERGLLKRSADVAGDQPS
jgi:hypothetical protein